MSIYETYEYFGWLQYFSRHNFTPQVVYTGFVLRWCHLADAIEAGYLHPYQELTSV